MKKFISEHLLPFFFVFSSIVGTRGHCLNTRLDGWRRDEIIAANGRWRGNSMKKQFMIGSYADHRHQPEMRTDGSLLRSRTILFLTFRPFARSINAGHLHLCRSGCTCTYFPIEKPAVRSLAKCPRAAWSWALLPGLGRTLIPVTVLIQKAKCKTHQRPTH